MLELVALLLLVAAVGGAVMLFAGLILGIVVAVFLSVLMIVLGVLGLIGKIVFFPMFALLWIIGHPVLTLALIFLCFVLHRNSRHAAI